MNLINSKVKHLSLGAGTVVAQDDNYISVEFSAKTSKFTYPGPDTFTKFLQAEDPAVQAAIIQEIVDAKSAVETQKRAEEEARLQAEEKCAAEAAARKTTTSANSQKKVAVKHERIPGKRMTFFVFQGNTYEQGSRGGNIWAPISNKEGDTFHHWDRLMDVRPGDIILHGCNGYVQAVSTAVGECYVCNQPDELRSEDLWDLEGRRVDCDYTPIKFPIKTADFVNDILRLCNVKYAPFNKDGGGNMGYLFELNRELARIFLQASVKSNSYLEDVDYIRELLAEADND